MGSHTYILTFDGTNPLLDYEGLTTFIKEGGDFAAWWHHIPFVFIVESELDADAISERLKRFTNGARFLVVRAGLDESEGWLPQSGWEWIRRREKRAMQATEPHEHA